MRTYAITMSNVCLNYNRSSFVFVFVDESGSDKRIGFRHRGWSARSVTPAKVAQFHRSQRYPILPAYSQDGVVLARGFQGNTDAEIFLDSSSCFVTAPLSRANVPL